MLTNKKEEGELSFFVVVLVPLAIKPVRWTRKTDCLRRSVSFVRRCSDVPVRDKWTYSNNGSNNEIRRVLSCGSWNDCLVFNSKGDGATSSHANRNGVETATFTSPVRQFYCCWNDQLYINSAQVKIVGFTPQLVTLQRGSGTVPYLLG